MSIAFSFGEGPELELLSKTTPGPRGLFSGDPARPRGHWRAPLPLSRGPGSRLRLQSFEVTSALQGLASYTDNAENPMGSTAALRSLKTSPVFDGTGEMARLCFGCEAAVGAHLGIGSESPNILA